ncbi:ankyrin repeat and EF-hand domain-containing protein 1 isoform X2 [Cottoperca gobio]|nr:ankyrin repeat and EF-hand domain-containing protein 1 isoform X2 [Cottoperca gobio]XP_029318436.1 ankyrin repeat and EF-hand domain-containing protein 1 isoform X2 [Cottoperca gobio]XP_029318437.1 ankyrin repeat and EF-hand domain-containing protein 1 isoform X2 [Cottoperca gobio]
MMSGRVEEDRLQVLQIYRLLQCVRKGDEVQIEKMVNLGVKNLINLTEPQDGTGVLHLAVTANNQDLVRFLLSQGANPNIQDKMGRTPVMLAAELGNDAIVTLLAQSHADLRLQDTEGKGVLFYCIFPTNRHTRCLQVALKGQADVNNVSALGTHVFQLMCEKAQECTTMCLIMLRGGADPNATNQKTGVTALMEAAKAGSLQLLRTILKRGGNPNALDRKRLTAVHYAAMGDFFELIQVLSAYSADMGVINLEECTPLHYAAAIGNANCCKFLAQRGCNPKLKNHEGFLPRHIAKDAGNKAAVKELKKAERQQGKGKKSSSVSLMSNLGGLTLHDWSHEYETELRQAFGNNSDTVTTEMFISVLEELKVPVELDQIHKVISAHDKGGEGCININDFIKGVKYIPKPFLLSSYMPKKKKGEKGGKGGKKKGKFVLPLTICTLPPELMPRRPDGGPPHFMIETYYNCSDIRRFDRDHPPEHPIMNDSGWYIEKPEKVYVNINYCVKSGDLESLDLALNQGVPVDVQDQFYKTPLMVACSSGNYKVAQYLLDQGADVNVCDQFFWTPLHHAAHAGQVELIELLVQAGATIDARALSGGTPLMRAIQSSRPSCVDVLIKAGASVNAENKKEQNCLDIARAFADSRIIDLVQDKMDSLPKLKEGKGKGGKAEKPKPAKRKSVAAEGAEHAETSTATADNTPPQKDSKSVILQNTRISTGKTNTVDITFVPKTVWGKPPTTSQLMSKIETRKRLSLELDFDDFMMPFSQNIQRKTLEPAITTDYTERRLGSKRHSDILES